MWSVPEDIYKNFIYSMICRILGFLHPLSAYNFRWDLQLISNAATNLHLYFLFSRFNIIFASRFVTLLIAAEAILGIEKVWNEMLWLVCYTLWFFF